MDLTTRCPKCGTVFQASLSDLQLRKGYIRCVQCAHIFDGYAEVVQDPTRGGTVQPSSAVADPEDYMGSGTSSAPDHGPVFEPLTTDPVGSESPPHVIRARRVAPHETLQSRRPEFTVGVDPWPDDGRGRDAAPDEPHVSFGGTGAKAGADPMDWPEASEASLSSGAIVVDAHPNFRGSGGSAAALLDDSRESPGFWDGVVRFFAWLLMALLVIAFVAQLFYVYRGQIAQFAPRVRPWLEQACVPLRCRVPYARNIGQMSVTGSALKVADTPSGSALVAGGAGTGTQQQTQHFVLQFTLRNQLDQPQEWPTVVLDLKDGSGTLLVRRNLSPAEYLGADMAGRPFAADSEALLRVPLTLDGVRINGYQLDLFFP
ncbi:MAG: DUF3426 domain-containing protein [Castellaniella sp.]|uniref:zinc-ribbon and DUF3426 domain-containing protein n=1 Tax=Castellaniella sp. TaxID=1955812 RepID=UPI0011F5EE84|nr:zinc-ribbon and DUF3426 domain-containing protein [Castellaniella sp.]TAN27435.1 MAG: DUF3426 domain-containing protein [Castellaniella sp.]